MQLKTPSIETNSLILRELTTKDISILLETFTRSQLQEYLDLETEEALDAEITKLSGATESPRFSFKIWYIIEKESKRIIGDVAYHIWFVKHHRAEIGYGLRQDAFKRKGYMSEAVAAVLEYGFSSMNLQRIEACVSPDNIASLGIIRKFGFQQEGYLRHHYHDRQTKTIDDSLLFSLLPKDFKTVHDTYLSLQTLVKMFERRNLPTKYWTHEAHLTMGIWYLSQYTKFQTICWLRSGIIAYNVAIGGKNTPTDGYHETITLFWIEVIAMFLKGIKEELSIEEKIEQFLASSWSDKNSPFEFYSQERLMSVEARAVWLAPDLKEMEEINC